MKRTVQRSICTALACTALAGSFASRASARTLHASGGAKSSDVFDKFTFTLPAGGHALTWQGTSATDKGSWWMPVPFDSPGVKTIRIKGKVLSSTGSLECQVGVVDSVGNVLFTSPLTPFPVTASFTSQVVTTPSVPAGGFGLVACALGGNLQALLLGIDYTP